MSSFRHYYSNTKEPAQGPEHAPPIPRPRNHQPAARAPCGYHAQSGDSRAQSHPGDKQVPTARAYLVQSLCSESFPSPPQNQPESQMPEPSWRTPILVYLPFVPPHGWQPLRTLRGFLLSCSLSPSFSAKHRAKWPVSVCFCLHLSPLSTELSGQPLCFFAPKGPPLTEIFVPKPVSWRQVSASIPPWSKPCVPDPWRQDDITTPRPPVAASKGEGCCGLGQGFPR